MKNSAVVILLLLLVAPQWLAGQSPEVDFVGPSAKRAFGLSLLVPGLGHRYVNGGRWDTRGTMFAMADGVAWISLIGARWSNAHFIQSYENLAVAHAGAQIDGQTRGFLVNVGQYDNSAEYVEVLLRARAWDRIEDAESPDQQWDWDTEEHRTRYKELRSDADRMERRTTWVAAILVGNRFLSAISALRAANKVSSRPSARVDFAPVDARGGIRARLVYSW